ncbi:hypothetical protein LXL04_002160 [Taraxacum kok-saghyz]
MNNTAVQKRPISVILDGTNYVMWNHHMTIHLKSLGLYSYVTGTTTTPVKSTDETDIAFGKRTDDWDIKNAKILNIHQQFLGYTTAKQVWDLLARRFTTTGLSHQYHLWSVFQSKRQQPDQSISQYVSEMQIIQDQLNAAAPQIFDETANQFRTYFSQLHLITLLMGLIDKFENVRASLLHRHPLPTLDASISELISEETRIRSRFPSSPYVCDSSLCVLFSSFGCLVQDPQTKETLGIGRRVGKMFEVVYLRLPPSSSNLVASTFSLSSFDIWHARLGHISQSRLKLLVQSGVLGTVKTESIFCSSCQLGKHHALPFVANEFKSTEHFDLIHSDVWGPAPHFTMGGARYFVIFIDDCTRFTWIYLMKHRSELPHIYITFARMIQTQFSKPIKIFRANNAMEYKASSLLSFLREQGTVSQYSCPGTSQQNGRAERKHRNILDTIRTLLISSQVPERFWGEAAFTAVYTINRHPTPVLQNKSPYELLHKTLPGYDILRVWGCACFVQLQSHERAKLEPRSRLCCFLGYGIEHKGYRCWDPISKRLRISRHVHSPLSSLFFTDVSISLDSHEPEFHDNESPPLSSTSTHLEDQIEDPTTTSQPIPETSPQSPDPLTNPSLETRPQRHSPETLQKYKEKIYFKQNV